MSALLAPFTPTPEPRSWYHACQLAEEIMNSESLCGRLETLLKERAEMNVGTHDLASEIDDLIQSAHESLEEKAEESWLEKRFGR